jgi:hypothetical protein
VAERAEGIDENPRTSTVTEIVLIRRQPSSETRCAQIRLMLGVQARMREKEQVDPAIVSPA